MFSLVKTKVRLADIISFDFHFSEPAGFEAGCAGFESPFAKAVAPAR